MQQRRISTIITKRLAEYPAVALFGSRQCGKTTLALTFGGKYFDLEQPPDRLRLDLSWDTLVQGDELIVLDEAQTWPEVFPRLRGEIDRLRSRNGRFLLLGSVSPALMTQVAESLAGRLALVELTPLLWPECRNAVPSLDTLWTLGGYPDGGVLGHARYPRWQRDYLELLALRDLPNWGLSARAPLTQRLLRMLAVVHAQEWNASQIGKSLGLSYHTVNSYLDFLEGTYLIRRLPAYHANIRKRLVKRPKVFWRDTGLLHAMCGLENPGSLFDQPWVGASWEGFVIEQILGALSSRDIAADPYYLRTSDQREIDLLLRVRDELWAIEIKLSARPQPADMRRLQENASLVGANRCILVSRSLESATDGTNMSLNLEQLIDYIDALD